MVRRRRREPQRSFELLLESVRPLQQRLQLTDELTADDVLFENVTSRERLQAHAAEPLR